MWEERLSESEDRGYENRDWRFEEIEDINHHIEVAGIDGPGKGSKIDGQYQGSLAIRDHYTNLYTIDSDSMVVSFCLSTFSYMILNLE